MQVSVVRNSYDLDVKVGQIDFIFLFNQKRKIYKRKNDGREKFKLNKKEHFRQSGRTKTKIERKS